MFLELFKFNFNPKFSHSFEEDVTGPPIWRQEYQVVAGPRSSLSIFRLGLLQKLVLGIECKMIYTKNSRSMLEVAIDI